MSEVFLLNQLEHDIIQMGKTQMCIDRAYNMVMQAADPKAAERVKRYLWSRIDSQERRHKR